MSDILVMGSGTILWATEEGVQRTKHNLIAVTTSGVVLYLEEDGTQSVSHGLDVEIHDVEWSAFATLVDKAALASEPVCSTCRDDQTVVAGMTPPRCPACGLKTNKH